MYLSTVLENSHILQDGKMQRSIRWCHYGWFFNKLTDCMYVRAIDLIFWNQNIWGTRFDAFLVNPHQQINPHEFWDCLRELTPTSKSDMHVYIFNWKGGGGEIDYFRDGRSFDINVFCIRAVYTSPPHDCIIQIITG